MSYTFTPQVIQTKNFTIEISTTRSFTSEISSDRSFTIQILGLFVTTSLRTNIKTGKTKLATVLRQTLNVEAPISFSKLLIEVLDKAIQYFSIDMTTGKLNLSTILKQTLSILSAPITFSVASLSSTLKSTINETVELKIPGCSFVATPEVRKYRLLLELDPETLSTLDPDTLTDTDYTLV